MKALATQDIEVRGKQLHITVGSSKTGREGRNHRPACPRGEHVLPSRDSAVQLHPGSGFFLIHLDGTPLIVFQFCRVLAKALQKAGYIKGATLHTLLGLEQP